MEKEQWIKEVLESTKNLERLEATPFLRERILRKVESGKAGETHAAGGIKWAFGLAAVLFITLNILSLNKAMHNKVNAVNFQPQIEGVNNQVIYNY